MLNGSILIHYKYTHNQDINVYIVNTPNMFLAPRNLFEERRKCAQNGKKRKEAREGSLKTNEGRRKIRFLKIYRLRRFIRILSFLKRKIS